MSSYRARCRVNDEGQYILTSGNASYGTGSNIIITNSDSAWGNVGCGSSNWVIATSCGTNSIGTITTNNWSAWSDSTTLTWKIEQPKAPAILNHRGYPIRSEDKEKQFSDVTPQELIALQLLRKMVKQDEFRHYLKHGFVSVCAKSGLIYQIHRLRNTTVWERGEKIASLCVHLKGVPPTDEVVGKILMVEYDEDDIWRRSNITWHTQNRARTSLELIKQAA